MLTSLIVYSNVHENASNRYLNVSAYRKILVLQCSDWPFFEEAALLFYYTIA